MRKISLLIEKVRLVFKSCVNFHVALLVSISVDNLMSDQSRQELRRNMKYLRSEAVGEASPLKSLRGQDAIILVSLYLRSN